MGNRLALYGEYDFARALELRSLLAALPDSGPITIDLTNVTYADSSFTRELAVFRRRLPNAKITLTVGDANMRRFLTLTSFDTIFDIVESRN